MIATASSISPTSFGSAGSSPSRSGATRMRVAAEGSPVLQSANGELAADAKKTRRRKPWAPSKNDHLAYQWVKLEGKRQSWVSDALGIDQSTVSRILQRYEKWQAHAQPGANGRLDPDERLRAQRWLTYERNEAILTSALRIAGEMEGFTDVTKTVESRPGLSTTGQRELRTEYSVLDRSGVAARFLRLAFRINMEQLKLVEKEPLAPLAPLTADDIEPEEDEAVGECVREGEEERGGGGDGETEVRSDGEAEGEDDGVRNEADGSEVVIRESNEAAVVELKVHNLHNCIAEESGASAEPTDTCAPDPTSEILHISMRAATDSPAQSGDG